MVGWGAQQILEIHIKVQIQTQIPTQKQIQIRLSCLLIYVRLRHKIVMIDGGFNKYWRHKEHLDILALSCNLGSPGKFHIC